MEQVFNDRKGNKVIKPKDKEVFQRISAYGIAIDMDNILLVKPTWKNSLDLPGGGIEKESILEGLKREFLEETGFHIKNLDEKPIKIKYSLFYADDLDTFFNSEMHFFRVKIISEQKTSLINKKEIKICSWHPFNKINDHEINPAHFEAIREAIKKI